MMDLLDLFLGGVVANLEPNLQSLLEYILHFSELSAAKGKPDLDSVIPFRHSGLHASTALSPVSSDVLDIYRRGHYFNVV